jgi:hypothetical protein
MSQYQLTVVLAVIFNVTAAAAIFHTTPASAQVASATAHYKSGVLTVHGRTVRPRQFVNFSGVIHRSNRVGSFIFLQTRLPPTCVVTLRSQGRSHRVPIRNCPLRAAKS